MPLQSPRSSNTSAQTSSKHSPKCPPHPSRITKTIKSVKDLVNEIIVIDSGSTDGTQEIAENLGCKVLHNKWNGFGPQKRFGEDCAKNKWLLNLDADEYLSNDLQLEIRDIFSKNLESNFYSMEVIPIYPNWNRPRWFSAHHLCVRLYNIDFGRNLKLYIFLHFFLKLRVTISISKQL